MFFKRKKNKKEEDYPNYLVQSIWEKAEIVPGVDSRVCRKDFAGAWICRSQYGKKNLYGWNVTHIKTVSILGKSKSDIRPIQWENNKIKGGNNSIFLTNISSENDRNVKKIKLWKI